MLSLFLLCSNYYCIKEELGCGNLAALLLITNLGLLEVNSATMYQQTVSATEWKTVYLVWGAKQLDQDNLSDYYYYSIIVFAFGDPLYQCIACEYASP